VLAALGLSVAFLLVQPPDPSHRAEIEAWRARRVANLTSAEGWLSVVGLFWLEEGENPIGSAPGSRVQLPASAPGRLGSIDLAAGRATFRPLPGADLTAGGKPVSGPVALASDAEEDTTKLRAGSVLFYLISRGGKIGVRVKDAHSDARRGFRGIDYFPIDPGWRIEARFEPYDPPRSISVPNVLGQDNAETSPGALVFAHGGRTYRLDPVLERGETDYFVIFGDATNGKETYGAGRFLYVKPPVNGKTVIDFNKAYNPPCVFTAFATCPLPPPQNKLKVSIAAGEKEYAH
jgi:uncharacterized protein (DUF1684 family)